MSAGPKIRRLKVNKFRIKDIVMVLDHPRFWFFKPRKVANFPEVRIYSWLCFSWGIKKIK